MSDNAGGLSEDTRGGVYSRSFLALVATQFFVSLNDNMFRWLVVPIGKELLTRPLGRDAANRSRFDEREHAGAIAGARVLYVSLLGVCRNGRFPGRSLQQAQRDGDLQGGRIRCAWESACWRFTWATCP